MSRSGGLAIVVPTLDEERLAPALLARLHALLGPADELLLVDGGSRDATLERVRALALPRLRLLESPPGRASQQNAGARASRAEWLLFLHADAELPPATLAAVRRATTRPEVGWGYCRVRLDERSLACRLVELGINLRSRACDTPTGDQALFVRRALFLAAGGFPEVALGEDLLLGDALRARAHPARLNQSVGTSARRWRRGGVLPTVLRMWTLRAALRLGLPPALLARAYPHVREPGAATGL